MTTSVLVAWRIPYQLSFLLLTGWILLQGSFFLSNTNSKVLGASLHLETATIIALINLKRQEAGLIPLTPHPKLNQAAEAKLNDMFQFGYWDHYSPSKRPPWSFILESGYDYHLAGENLAKNFTQNSTLVEAWMNSPSHKENILNPQFKDTGVAYKEGTLNNEPTILIVQMFGTPFDPKALAPEQLSPPSASFYTSSIMETSTPIIHYLQNNLLKVDQYLIAGILLLLAVILIVPKLHLLWNSSKQKPSHHYWGHFIFLLVTWFLFWAVTQTTIA